MGLFSWECNGCHKSLVGYLSTNTINRWMSSVVALDKDTRFIGAYDGYGRIETQDDVHTITIETEEGTCDALEEVYHFDCWVKAGKPPAQTLAGSKSADDQGHFFDEEDYNIPGPLTVAERLAAITEECERLVPSEVSELRTLSVTDREHPLYVSLPRSLRRPSATQSAPRTVL